MRKVSEEKVLRYMYWNRVPTKVQLARRMGISRQRLNLWIKGGNPTLSDLDLLANTLGCGIEDLLDNVPDPGDALPAIVTGHPKYVKEPA